MSVLPSSVAIKKTARLQLRNNWFSAIAVSLIFIAVICFCVSFATVLALIFSKQLLYYKSVTLIGGIISALVTVTSVILTVPLFQGCIRWFWFLGIERPLPISQVFYYYGSFKLALKPVFLYAQLLVYEFFICALCYAPAIAAAVISNRSFNSLFGISTPAEIPSLWPFTYILIALCTLLVIKISLRYLLAPVILSVSDDIDTFTAIKISKILYSQMRNRAFTIFLSFLGWIVLSVFGITLVYTLPFMLMSYAIYTKFSINVYRVKCNFENSQPII